VGAGGNDEDADEDEDAGFDDGDGDADVDADDDDDGASIHFTADSILIFFLMLYACSTLTILLSVAVHRATSRSSKKSFAKWSNTAEGQRTKGEGETKADGCETD